jgi:hypothetical protein
MFTTKMCFLAFLKKKFNKLSICLSSFLIVGHEPTGTKIPPFLPNIKAKSISAW